MTDPVDTDALRETADAIGHLAGDVTAQQDIEAAADELERLRVVIENAPHGVDCRAQFHGGDRYGYGGDDSYCICWKAGAL